MWRLSTKWNWMALVALLWASEAAAQRLPFTWDVPRTVGVVDVPGEMKAGGIPVKLRAVRSTEKPQVLLQHIVRRFEAWGFYIPPIETQAQPFREPQITALDLERLISYTAIFQPNPDGTTTVYLGEANLSQPPAKLSPIAPVYPGARDVLSTDVEVARSLSYAVAATPEQVQDFYRAELSQQGYAETEPQVYRLGADELQVMVRAPKPGQSAVVVLHRTVPANEAPNTP
ncbi:hypothetical protein [Hyalangium gracile]|uniref:hypothetical protein n=1 Tax=Hyalangium gracile TaxID=394092 RepID=UPI001CCE7F61|nr:hypothetical protein [Hyalangium gracile]